MANSILIKNALKSSLAEAGFKKRSDTWYWENSDVVQLINLQKSQYGGQYFVNCGIAFKSLGFAEFPKEHHCQIRFRLTGLAPAADREQIESVFDLGNELLTDKERSAEIVRLIRNIALPVLNKCTSIPDITARVKDGTFAHALILKEAKELFWPRS